VIGAEPRTGKAPASSPGRRSDAAHKPKQHQYDRSKTRTGPQQAPPVVRRQAGASARAKPTARALTVPKLAFTASPCEAGERRTGRLKTLYFQAAHIYFCRTGSLLEGIS